MPGRERGPADPLVVRVPGGWRLTPLERRDPTELDLDALRALLEATPGVAASTPAASPLPEPLSPGSLLRPVGAVVASPVAGGLAVEDATGVRVVLDLHDLAILDAVDVERSVEEVHAHLLDVGGGASPSLDEVGARVRRLATGGQLYLHREVAPSEAGADGPAVESEAPSARRPSAATRLRVALARRQFPGRALLAAAYRTARPAVRRLRGVAPTPAESEPVVDRAAEEAEPPAPFDDPTPEAGPADTNRNGNVWPPLEIVYFDHPHPGEPAPDAVPVYAPFQVDIGPALSLGMLTASARAWDGGRLAADFEIRRPEHPASMLADLAERSGPAILLCSDYVWSLDHNLALAREAKRACPELFVVHGGPSAPKYEGDAERFFAEHGDVVDVVARGEGEHTIAELLAALAPGLPAIDVRPLAEVPGITYRDPDTGTVVRTPDRERMADLDELPSPYLTGEYDHLHPSAWDFVTIETTRGCPYGCTFCDWGSSTLSRIRKFDIDRVEAEMVWAARRGNVTWALGDANFGIISRDVEVAERLSAVRAEYGVPTFFGFNVAKNTTKHLTAIVDHLVDAGISPIFSLALQTRDEATLEAVHRQNISTDHYVALAASMRRRGLPLQADIMIGLPGQTVASLWGDLQFLLDHDIPARMWITQMLPNAPINDPDYRAEHQVVSDENNVVVSTSSFTEEDREMMLAIRHAYTVCERFGLLRHVLRFVQWDHGVPMTTVLRRIIELDRTDPARYPLLSWTQRYFDYFTAPPVGWRTFYDEVRRFVLVELGVPPSDALDTVLQLQAFLMPAAGRRLPETTALAHDVRAHFDAHTYGLWATGEPAPCDLRLEDLPAAAFTVYGDPLDKCGKYGIRTNEDPRNEAMTEDFWMAGHWALDSPLVANTAQVAGSQSFLGLIEQIPPDLPDLPEHGRSRVPAAVRVAMRGGRGEEPDAGND